MRIATAVRLVLGSACLAAPEAVLAAVGGPDRGDPTIQQLARVFGGRLVLQAVADLTLGRRTRRPGVVVEMLHAGSMVPVAARRPEHRRTALTSAGLAAGIGLIDLHGDKPEGGAAR